MECISHLPCEPFVFHFMVIRFVAPLPRTSHGHCAQCALWRPQVLSSAVRSSQFSELAQFRPLRISYVSILNRLFMFEFYCIFLCSALGQFFFSQFFYCCSPPRLLSCLLCLVVLRLGMYVVQDLPPGRCRTIGYIKFHKSYAQKSSDPLPSTLPGLY